MKWGMLLVLLLVSGIFFVSLIEAQNASKRCDPGLTNCNETCVDITSDPQNCGECGSACSAVNGSTKCSEGSCTIISCDEGWGDCDGIYDNGCEANIQSNDIENCGGCGILCNSTLGGYCDNGVCACTDPLLTSCIDAAGDFNCVDIQTDKTNCGGCGKVCVGACVEGACYPTMPPAIAENMSAESPMPYSIEQRVCPDDYPTVCNGECADTTSDPYNCGICGHECERATCVNGVCVLDSWQPTSSLEPSARAERESRN